MRRTLIEPSASSTATSANTAPYAYNENRLSVWPGDQVCCESRPGQPRRRNRSWYVSPRAGSSVRYIRPSDTAMSWGRVPLSGDPGSTTEVRINLSRSMLAAVKTADPTLAMVLDPEWDGAFGN